MSGLLSVIEGNPRRRRRARRKGHKKAKARTRRRHHVRAANPRHHRRRHVTHRLKRRANPRRRRHRNPLGGGAIVQQLMKAGSLGLAFVAAEAAGKAANFYIFKDKPVAGPALIGLKAGIGIAGYFGLKALKQESLGKFFLLGAGISAVVEAYKQFVQPSLVTNMPWLADYSFGNLQGYRTGQLQGWAPQAGLSGWAPQAGLSDDSSGDAYAAGAYN
jgi:hypothetical protein